MGEVGMTNRAKKQSPDLMSEKCKGSYNESSVRSLTYTTGFGYVLSKGLVCWCESQVGLEKGLKGFSIRVKYFL